MGGTIGGPVDPSGTAPQPVTPPVGETLTILPLRGAILRDSAGRLWLGVVGEQATDVGGVMSHAQLPPGETVRVVDTLADGLVVVKDPPPDDSRVLATTLDAYPLQGTLLAQVEQELQD